MSRFHYLASPVPLPCGERGLHYTIQFDGHMNNRYVMVFESEEDAAGIMLHELSAYHEAVRLHLKQPYIYQITAEGGAFEIPENVLPELALKFLPERKCCRLLGELLQENAVPGAYFEFYSCWAGEEDWPRADQLDRDVDLASFVWEEGLQPQEKQYIRIFCSRQEE